MNESMQKCIAWHPLGIQGEALLEWSMVVDPPRLDNQTAVSSKTFLTIDQSMSYGFCRNARVINF